MIRLAGVLSSMCLLVSCAVAPAQSLAQDNQAPLELSMSKSVYEGAAVIQVLGSGGPVPDVNRASSGYLLWLDGKSRVLIDAGGGTFVRFAQSGAKIEDLWFVGLSHFHTDHSAEFPAFVKGAYFSSRTDDLPIAGPSGSDPFPGLNAYLAALFDKNTGAYRYLSGFYSGGEKFQLQALQSDHSSREKITIWKSNSLEVSALGVPHGIVPALAYRLEFSGLSVVFASDQNGSAPEFIKFAQDADLLVMHLPIPEGTTGGALQLHARPSKVGKIAEASGAKRLLLSHFMQRSLAQLDDSVAEVRKHYSGQLLVARDLFRITFPGDSSKPK